MEWSQELRMELIKTGLTASLTIFTLGLGWLVGQRWTHYWAVRQRRRESQLAAAAQFQEVYGEFFAVWKLWRLFLTGEGQNAPAGARWELLQRAAATEAKLEAINVKLASENALTPADAHALGRFRQAVQQLRQAIRANTTLPWTGSESPDYLVFKEMACRVNGILSTRDQGTPPAPEEAFATLRLITTNWWETHWKEGTAPSPTYFARSGAGGGKPSEGRQEGD